MPLIITLSPETLLQQAKLSCQMPGLIESIITRQVVFQVAQENGIEVATHELQQAADQFRLQHNLETVEDTMDWLNCHHLSLDEFEEMLQINLLSSKLAHYLFADQLRPYFAAHRVDYLGAAIYEVVLDDEDLAIELFYALQEGEISFWEIAVQYIEDVELRRKGGYQGVVKRQDMKPEISAKVFAVNPPQVLKPVVTAQGVHLILVEEIVQPELNDQLQNQILNTLFKNWLQQQIQQTKISPNLNIN